MYRQGLVVAIVSIGLSCAFDAAASAQGLRPPGGIPGFETDNGVQPAQAQDAASLMVRIDRLEGQLRQQNGQIEDMQFRMKRLEDQLRKFQEDVDFRFQDASGRKPPGARPASGPPTPAPGKRTDLNENNYPIIAQDEATATQPIDAPPRVASAARPGRKGGDAFDPDADPNAPGAPRALGETPSPSVPPRQTARRIGPAPAIDPGDDDTMGDAADTPMDLHGDMGAPRREASVPALGAGASGPPRVLGGPDMAAAPPVATARSDFDAALAQLRANQFDASEESFRSFLRKYPKDRLAADATFYLGESFYKRQRAREAAEQYLKVSTDYDKSARAPEALLKLGLSLEKLGAREQACVAYGELARKYPTASASLKASADREAKRAQC